MTDNFFVLRRSLSVCVAASKSGSERLRSAELKASSSTMSRLKAPTAPPCSIFFVILSAWKIPET
jgi:hypothetical protein